jgi:hypothetical protein
MRSTTKGVAVALPKIRSSPTRVRADCIGTDVTGRPRPPHRAFKDTALSKRCAAFGPVGSTKTLIPAPKLCVARTVCQRGRRVADSTSFLRGRIAVGRQPDGRGLRGCGCAGSALCSPRHRDLANGVSGVGLRVDLRCGLTLAPVIVVGPLLSFSPVGPIERPPTSVTVHYWGAVKLPPSENVNRARLEEDLSFTWSYPVRSRYISPPETVVA